MAPPIGYVHIIHVETGFKMVAGRDAEDASVFMANSASSAGLPVTKWYLQRQGNTGKLYTLTTANGHAIVAAPGGGATLGMAGGSPTVFKVETAGTPGIWTFEIYVTGYSLGLAPPLINGVDVTTTSSNPIDVYQRFSVSHA